MKERPIVFNGPMVRALLEGRKTQTRRIVKDPNGYAPDHPMSIHEMAAAHPARDSGFVFWYPGGLGTAEFTKQQYANGLQCPYGVAGDRLYVRETVTRKRNDPEMPCDYATYAADCTPIIGGDDLCGRACWRWKRDTLPSIFMPKDFARIWLEVTDVRVQRLQEITPEEVEKEGVGVVPKLPFHMPPGSDEAAVDRIIKLVAHRLMKELWDSLSVKHSWESNPWVWVMTFEVVK